ncbi:MAG: helix-turn-helix domain-containing protein [Corynebacterium sp.]|nr:helix-turn-helix domain-containing protein [Nocardioides sp.]MDN6511101.1 helix-turn-helix domain-containing protein [Corynebacterium sp.]
MTATMPVDQQISINETIIEEAKNTPVSPGVTLSLKTSDGQEIALPAGVERVLLQTLASISDHGEVSIGRIPNELTSTVAADMLGVSRTTLMKWARQGKIGSYKVGSHTRFTRDEVQKAQQQRAHDRKKALDRLLTFEVENDDVFDD